MSFYTRHCLPWVLEGMMSYPGMAAQRRAALAGARGEVLEIGFGSGKNLPHYPPEVTRVVGVEPAGEFSRLARKRIDRSSIPVEVVGLAGEHIDTDSSSFDSVVSTFTMCSIASLDAALAQCHRVLKPDGRLHFLEHGLAAEPSVQRMQRRLNRPWGAVMGGCRLDVAIEDAIRAAGFAIESLDKQYLGGGFRFATYFYRGVARKG